MCRDVRAEIGTSKKGEKSKERRLLVVAFNMQS